MTPASGSTPGGLPYPTTGDRLADTDAYIAELADAVAVKLANPGVVLFKRQMATDGNGESWQSFSTLARVDGAIAQMLTGVGQHTVYACVARLDGAQSVQFRFRTAPISTYSAAMAPWANGSITVCGYVWGVSA